MKHTTSRHSAAFFSKRFFGVTLQDALLTAGIYTLTCILCAALHRHSPDQNYVSMLFILAVFMTARFTHGYTCGILASVAGVLTVNYLFTYPFLSFNFTLSGYPLTILCMLAVSITTSTLTTQAKQSELMKIEAEKEKTRSNLLRAVSHDLRTPLTSILGAASVVVENDATLTSRERTELLRGAQEDAQWLIRVVENLLAVTRIGDEGSAKVTKTPQAAEEVVSEVIAKFKKFFPHMRVSVRVPDDLLLIPMDAVLIEQVLFNLLENAATHGICTDHILLSVTLEGGKAVFEVRDNGVGITPEKLPRIFETAVNRPAEGATDSKRNMGIGLSVCSTIIKAHGGTIQAANAPEGGAVFRFVLDSMENENGTQI